MPSASAVRLVLDVVAHGGAQIEVTECLLCYDGVVGQLGEDCACTTV